MVNAGVKGFKCFLVHSGVDEFPCVTENDVRLAMQQMQGTDAVFLVCIMYWTRDGAVVRALAPHQYGLGLIPGLGVLCGIILHIEFVVGSGPHSESFSLGSQVFPSPLKPTFPNSKLLIWNLRATGLSVVTDC